MEDMRRSVGGERLVVGCADCIPLVLRVLAVPPVLVMSKRVCLALGTPSVLLASTEDSTDTSSDDDDARIYATKFAELFTVPSKIPKVNNYVDTAVNFYSEKEVRNRLQRMYQTVTSVLFF